MARRNRLELDAFKARMEREANRVGMTRRQYIDIQVRAWMEETGESYVVARDAFIGSVIREMRRQRRATTKVTSVEVYAARPRATETA